MTTQTNPGESLNAATAAGAGSSIQLGASGANLCPAHVSVIAVVSGWSAAYNPNVIAAYPYANIGLDVSMDGTNWVRVANAQVPGNGVFKAYAAFPALYARAYIDQLDSRISAITVTAYVAGG